MTYVGKFPIPRVAMRMRINKSTFLVSCEMEVRIRLRFSSTPLHYANKCCFLFQRDACRTVGDLIYLITARFGVEATGVQLFLDDFLLPPNENISIIRDNDLIEVRTVEDGDNPITSSNKRQKKNTDVPALTSSNNKAQKKRRKEPSLAKDPATSSSKNKEESVPPPRVPAGRPRVMTAVERKSATGGVHLTFHSTSPSPSSGASSDSSSSPAVLITFHSSSSSSSSTSSSSDDDSHTTRNKEASLQEKQHAKSSSRPSVSSSSTAKNKTVTTTRGSPTSKAMPDSSPHAAKNKTVTPKGKKTSTNSKTTPVSSAEKSGRAKNQLENGAARGNSLNSGSTNSENNVTRGGTGGRGRRRGRGRGRGGWVVGGESDVLTVESVVFKSPGETSRGRGRGRGRGGGGWDVKAQETTTAETREHEDKKSDTRVPNTAPAKEGSIWEKSTAGFTEEHAQGEPPSAEEEEGTEVMDEGDKMEPTVAEVPVARDYSSLPPLLGAPRVGDTIAFKVLELSSNCTPEMSDYKEAEVTAYEPSTSTVTLKYLNSQQNNTTHEGSLRSELLRSDVMTEEGKEEDEVIDDELHNSHVTFSLGSLLQPKLIT